MNWLHCLALSIAPLLMASGLVLAAPAGVRAAAVGPGGSVAQTSSSFYWDRAAQRERQGDYQGAVEDYTRALGLLRGVDRSRADLYSARGWARAKAGDAPGAIEDFTRAL